MPTAIIVEDEPQYAELIKSLLSTYYPDVALIGIAFSLNNAEELISTVKPDIVFMDIELMDGTAFDLLRRLQNISFQIIFITAHNEFAIQAFKFSAVDYLLKPVQKAEFCNAMDKAVDRMNLKQIQHIRLMLENLDRNNEYKRLVLRTLEQIHIINTHDIIRCQADNSYTTFHLVNAEKILVSKGLKEYEDLLCKNGFFKTHQSHIINLKFIRKIDKSTEEIILSDKTRVPLSSRRKQMLLQILDEQ